MIFKHYYQLTKPGIIYGNLLTAAAGFLLASPHHIDLHSLVLSLGGITLVIASACVFNNYMDRDIDKKMARTKKRALVTKEIPVRNALIFASILGIAGIYVLSLYKNSILVVIGLVGFIDYVFLYGYSKRRSVHGTLVGSISGAMPVLAGYCAARGQLDKGGLIALLILILWQMPHFYGIAMYRYDDYKAAGVPVLSVVKGMRATKIQVLSYIVAFIVASSLLTFYGYTGIIFLVVMTILGLAWLGKGYQNFNGDDKKWGRKMFLFSLIVIIVTSTMLAIGPRLP